jgi:FixJ family two-component response regulator
MEGSSELGHWDAEGALVSIVEDDRYFRESLRLLMTSLDYNVRRGRVNAFL